MSREGRENLKDHKIDGSEQGELHACEERSKDFFAEVMNMG